MKLFDIVGKGKNIMVYDVAADSSGALSVLCDFYADVKDSSNKTKQWYFIVSKPEFDETDNIKVLRFPWIKKSWLHRLYFDHFVAPRLAKKIDIDEVVNLQNIWIPIKGIHQTVYLHQSLPFAEYKFGMFEDFKLWMYQNVIAKFIFSSLKKADRTIVQTNWIKEACADKARVDANRIEVIPPIANMTPTKCFVPSKQSLSTFFYPATPIAYKNHQVIIDACKQLKADGINGYKVIFTFKGNENKLAKRLHDDAVKNDLPIEFAGQMPREKVFEWYTKSVLLFPSHIETFGLPLLEARMHGTPVIAADTPFAREILEGYSECGFVDAKDAGQYANAIRYVLSKR